MSDILKKSFFGKNVNVKNKMATYFISKMKIYLGVAEELQFGTNKCWQTVGKS